MKTKTITLGTFSEAKKHFEKETSNGLALAVFIVAIGLELLAALLWTGMMF